MRLWRPANLSAGGPGLLNHRLLLVRFLAIAVELVCFFGLLPVLGAARFIFHLPVPGRVLAAVFIAAMAASATIYALQLWALFRSGRWMALDGRIHLRADHPRRFRALATTVSIVVAAWFAGVGYLIWWLLL